MLGLTTLFPCSNVAKARMFFLYKFISVSRPLKSCSKPHVQDTQPHVLDNTTLATNSTAKLLGVSPEVLPIRQRKVVSASAVFVLPTSHFFNQSHFQRLYFCRPFTRQKSTDVLWTAVAATRQEHVERVEIMGTV